MQTYSIYIEYTDTTYDIITRQCSGDQDAEFKAISHAEDQDQEIYFIEATPTQGV
jgi:hypothetical protein